VANGKKSDDEPYGDSQIVMEWIAMGGDTVGAAGGALLGFLLGGDAPGVAVGAGVGSLVIFDFERPKGRDFTETIMTLAGIAILNVHEPSNRSKFRLPRLLSRRERRIRSTSGANLAVS
jgi:hypothetical protein